MIHINTTDLVEKAVTDSKAIIFKHSGSCPISFRAHRQVKSFEQDFPEQKLYIVDVNRHRTHSLDIAERLDLRHESPQIMLVDRSKVVWDASHLGVTSAAIERAINQTEE